MRQRTAPWLVALAPAGVLLGHAAGEMLASTPAPHAAAHGHIGDLGLVATATLLLGLLTAAVLRTEAQRGPSTWRLAAIQSTAFLGLEALEVVASGHTLTALTTPSVVLGLAVQPLAAWLIVRAASVALHWLMPQAFVLHTHRRALTPHRASLAPHVRTRPVWPMTLGRAPPLPS